MEESKYGNHINGKEDFEGQGVFLRSPVDGSEIAAITKSDSEKTREAIDAAEAAFRNGWGKTSLIERKKLLARLAGRVQERSEIYSALESLNTGKTIRQSTMMDIPLGIEHISYFGNSNEFVLEREIEHPEFPGTKGIVQYAPMGVVGAIAPWNVPFLMAVWKIAPALLAGNTVVLKPSHHTPLTALELARDMKACGFPNGVVNIVTGDGSVVGEALSRSAKVNMVSFTGSTSTGRKIMQSASENIKKVTLELGGKSPNIVFEDADLDRAAKGVLFGIFLNSGQLCESGSRLILQSSIRDRFLSRLKKHMEMMKSGNPMDMETDISAITTPQQKAKIETMVERGLSDGAKVFFQKNLGTSTPEGGMYYPPTLLTEVSNDMEIGNEEIFGPVLSVMEFEHESEAVEISNSSIYGLAAGVWSLDKQRAKRVASSLESGTVWMNEYHLLSAAAPRGGFKNSGIGRELGLEGTIEYTQTRHIFMNSGESELDDVVYGLVLSNSDDGE